MWWIIFFIFKVWIEIQNREGGESWGISYVLGNSSLWLISTLASTTITTREHYIIATNIRAFPTFFSVLLQGYYTLYNTLYTRQSQSVSILVVSWFVDNWKYFFSELSQESKHCYWCSHYLRLFCHQYWYLLPLVQIKIFPSVRKYFVKRIYEVNISGCQNHLTFGNIHIWVIQQPSLPLDVSLRADVPWMGKNLLTIWHYCWDVRLTSCGALELMIRKFDKTNMELYDEGGSSSTGCIIWQIITGN